MKPPKDKYRKWIWRFLGLLVLSQWYYVYEIASALLLFTVLFCALLLATVMTYAAFKVWEFVVTQAEWLIRWLMTAKWPEKVPSRKPIPDFLSGD
jgi:hypothetical protein